MRIKSTHIFLARALLLMVLVQVIFSNRLFAEYFVANTSGNWVATADWDMDGGFADHHPGQFDAGDTVYIGGSYTMAMGNNPPFPVTLTVDGSATLQIGSWTLKVLNATNNSSITATSGTIEVQGNMINSGTITMNNGDIEFSNNGDKTLTINGGASISLDMFSVDNVTTLTIQGSGDLTIGNDFDFTSSNATVTNNLTGNFILDGSTAGAGFNSYIQFNSGSWNRFVNNETVDITDPDGGIYVNNWAGNTITNYGTLNFDKIDYNTRPLTINNYGTINQSSDFVDATSLHVQQVNNHNGGTWNWYGSTMGDIELYCNIDGANTFNYTRSGNQTVITPEDAYWNIELSGSGTKSAGGSFEVKGDWTNNNVSFSAMGYTVSFTGTNDQYITKAGLAEFFYGLTVNKASGNLVFNDNVTVLAALTLSSGNVDAQTYMLTMSHAAPFNLVRTSGYVIGKFRRNCDNTYNGGSYIFPVGSVGNYSPITLNLDNITDGYLTAEFISADPGENGEFPLDDAGTSIHDRFSDGYWTITPNGSFASTDIDITLRAAGFVDYPISASSRLIYRSGSDWELSGNHSDASDPEVYRTSFTAGISGATTFGLGYSCSAIDGGEIDEDQTICYNAQPAAFTNAISPSNGGATPTYQWQKEVGGGGFTNIVGANALTYAEPDNLTQTTLYRRRTTTVCGTVYSDTVTVSIEADKPVLTCGASGTQSVNTNNNCLYIHGDNSWNGSATDNCTAAGTIAISYELYGQTQDTVTTLNGQSFNIGLTWVRMVAEDEAGNIDSCSFTVDVADDDDPAINTCAADTNVHLDADCEYSLPDFTGDTDLSITECSPYLVTQSPLPGSTISDTTLVTLTVTDEYGNIRNCNFYVNTLDTIRPVITACAADTNVHLDADCEYSLPDFTSDTDLSITECSPYLVTQSPLPGSTISDTTEVFLMVTDEYGNTRVCSFFVNTLDTIRPTFTVPPTDTICRNVDCSYSVDISITGDVTDESDNCSVSIEATYSDDLSNLINCTEAGYIIRKWTLVDNSGNETSHNQIIWIQPVINITSVDDTICNGEITNIDIQSTNNPLGGIRYTWVVSNPSGFIGGASDSENNGNILSRNIQQTLINSDDSARSVTYRITPHTIHSDSSLHCSGPSIDVTVWVEPTITITSEDDTICNGEYTNIDVQSTNNSTRGIRYTWTVNDPSGQITGQSASTGIGYPIGRNLVQQLSNSDSDAHEVVYTITPHAIRGDSSLHCSGPSIDVTVWVEPTPQVFLERLEMDHGHDSIFCSGLSPRFRINSPTNPTYDIRFRYGIEPVSPTDISYTYTGDTAAATKGIIDSDIVNNYSTTVQGINVIVTPYLIDQFGNEKCSVGEKDTLYYEVTPELRILDTLRSYVFDTLHIKCFGESNGVVYPNASGGIMAYGYTFNDIDYSFNSFTYPAPPDSIFNLSAGNYPIRIEDWSGCVTESITTLNQPPKLGSVLEIADNVECEGDITDLYVNPYGGTYYTNGTDTLGYTVTWTKYGFYGGPNTNPLINAGGNGIYKWEVVDSNQCIDSNSYDFNETVTRVGINIEPISQYNGYHVSCYNLEDGGIQAVANPLEADLWIYDSTWTLVGSGTSEVQVTGLGAGTFYGIVETSIGCVDTASTILTEPDSVIIESVTSSTHGIYNVSCWNKSDGSISIDNITGGRGAYEYNWYLDGNIIVGEHDPLIDSIGIGNYRAEVSDIQGCTDTVSIQLISADSITAQLESITNVACFNESTGEIEISAQGGLGALNYFWPHNGATTNIVSNLLADTYIFQVSDVLSCVYTDSVTVTQPDEIVIASSLSDFNGYEVSCFEGLNSDNGWIDLTGTIGGTGAYNYTWEDASGPVGSNNNRLNSLVAGNYYVTVQDANNCEQTASFTMESPGALQLTILDTTPEICDVKGTAEVSVSGGLPDYSINWGNGLTGPIQNNLESGTYNLTITDLNACVLNEALTIRLESDLVAEIVIIDSVSCHGGNDGVLGVEIENASSAIDYIWDSDPTRINSTLTEAGRGQHTVRISDDYGCWAEDVFILSEPTKIVTNNTIHNILCYGEPEGMVEFEAVGGNGGFTYLWDSTEIIGTSIEGQYAGAYTLITRDRKGCEKTEDIIIHQLDEIKLEIPEGGIVEPDCEFSFNGSIQVDARGGTFPYTFKWTNIGDLETDYVSELRAGSYTVQITDVNNCQVEDVVVLENRMPACLDIISGFTPNGDGVNDRWLILNPANEMQAIGEVYPNMIVEIYDRSGQKRWKSMPGYSFDPNEGWDGRDRNGNILPVDTYYYFIHLNNNSGVVLQDIVTIIR